MKLRRMRKARSLNCTKLYRLYRGGSRGGGVQGVCNLRFSNTTGILQKKKLCGLNGVEVERETSAPRPKKILDPPLL